MALAGSLGSVTTEPSGKDRKAVGDTEGLVADLIHGATFLNLASITRD